MKELEYHQSNDDRILFFKHSAKDITILLIYIDDMTITRDDKDEIVSLKSWQLTSK